MPSGLFRAHLYAERWRAGHARTRPDEDANSIDGAI
jgi:hypothetical protein